MKRSMSLFLCIVLCFGMAGCNDKVKTKSELVQMIEEQLSISAELVSSEEVYPERMIKYLFRDINGVEFYVWNYLQANLSVGLSSEYASDYTYKLMQPYFEDMRLIFEDAELDFDIEIIEESNAAYYYENDLEIMTQPLHSYYGITINTFSQVSALVDSLEQCFELLPVLPFKNNQIFNTPYLSVNYSATEGETRWLADFYVGTEEKPMKFSSQGLMAQWENKLADDYKLGYTDMDIPMDALKRNPPSAFRTLIINGAPKEFHRIIRNEDMYILDARIFSTPAHFNTLVNALGGEYESLYNPDFNKKGTDWQFGARWTIGDNTWEGYQYEHNNSKYEDGSRIEIYKNGILLDLSDINWEYVSLKSLEDLLDVTASYENEQAILYVNSCAK